MKKSLLLEVIDHLKARIGEPHLTLDELRIAVFDEEQPDKITSHLSKCKMCSNLVAREQQRNPIYYLMKEADERGLTREEFWEDMNDILRSMKRKWNEY